jgi:hypothetical protein
MQLACVRPPANAFIFFGYLFEILALDPIDMGDFYDENLLLDEEAGPFTPNFEFLGFETYYTLQNIGSIIIFILLTTAAGTISTI